MKSLLLALLLLSFPLSACEAKDPITGIYQETFENGMISPDADGEKCEPPLKIIGTICAEPYMATNTLGIFQQENGDLDFTAELSFFNGHSCSIDGVAKKNADGWLYEAQDAEEKCKLTIAVKDDKITFATQEGFECQYYCGARGSLGGTEFPLSSKTKQTISSKNDLDCISSVEEPCKNDKE